MLIMADEVKKDTKFLNESQKPSQNTKTKPAVKPKTNKQKGGFMSEKQPKMNGKTLTTCQGSQKPATNIKTQPPVKPKK